jgi:hypothetical protein
MKRQDKLIFKGVGLLTALVIALSAVAVCFPVPSYAGEVIPVSVQTETPLLRGIRVYPDQPFKFDFILDAGNTNDSETLYATSLRSINYFLAALTMPEDGLWVNLSPDEPDRIIDDNLAMTDLGADMLDADEYLKRVVSSLTHPNTETGVEYWRTVKFKSEIRNSKPETSKVWIKPEKAVVYEDSHGAFIAETVLGVHGESDALVLVLPTLTDRVNAGEDFARVRQMYHSVVLAAWYKKRLKDSLLGRVYVDQKKMKGIDTSDPAVKEAVYQAYMEAFKKGVYDLIRKERDVSGRLQKRRYFSGGIKWVMSSTVEFKSGSIDNVAKGFDDLLLVEGRARSIAGSAVTEQERLESLIPECESVIAESDLASVVLEGLGTLKPTGVLLTEGLAALPGYRMVDIPFVPSAEGLAFAAELFEMPSQGLRLDMRGLVPDSGDGLILYGLILRNDEVKRAAQVNMMELFGMDLSSRQIRTLFYSVQSFLVDRYGPNSVDGVMMRADEEDGVPLLYLSRPSLIRIARGRSTVLRGLDNDDYDVPVVMPAKDEFHRDFKAMLDYQGKQGAFSGRAVGVMGTGQGGDILTILKYGPRKITANDISPLAVRVSNWNLDLARKRGLIDTGISVRIGRGADLEGMDGSEVIVFNTPGINPPPVGTEQPLSAGNLLFRREQMIYSLPESEARSLLSRLGKFLLKNHARAFIRVNVDISEFGKQYEYLRESGLDAVPAIENSFDLFDVRSSFALAEEGYAAYLSRNRTYSIDEVPSTYNDSSIPYARLKMSSSLDELPPFEAGLRDSIVQHRSSLMSFVAKRKSNVDNLLGPRALEGFCGEATLDMSRRLRDWAAENKRNLVVREHQVKTVLDEGSGWGLASPGYSPRHGFLVVTDEDADRHYLVDTTLIQFCDPQTEDGALALDVVRKAGCHDLLRSLLADGYIELDDRVAAMYAGLLKRQYPLNEPVPLASYLQSATIYEVNAPYIFSRPLAERDLYIRSLLGPADIADSASVTSAVKDALAHVGFSSYSLNNGGIDFDVNTLGLEVQGAQLVSIASSSIEAIDLEGLTFEILAIRRFDAVAPHERSP